MRKMVDVLSRAGLAAKGVNYVLIGLVATAAVLHLGHRATGRSAAWRTLVHQPYGRVLMGALAAGFLCYAVWRVLTGWYDLERHGRGPGGLLLRTGTVLAGLSYVLLGVSAAKVAVGNASPPRDDAQARTLASTLLDQPLGVALVFGVAAGFAIAGIVLGVMAIRATFAKRLDLSRMSPGQRRFALRVGRLGNGTLAFLCFMFSAFFFFAGATHDSREAKGLAGAFRTLAEQPLGHWLLAFVALGFIAHGLFQFMEMRFRRQRFAAS
ncbi:MAG: DUF1206 domain-containing protein [Archangiaceae bacterium]|nr:DUF1206 domain-containing protein [Archangiaceae bacterium]